MLSKEYEKVIQLEVLWRTQGELSLKGRDLPCFK
jgi:hypothetical protein